MQKCQVAAFHPFPPIPTHPLLSRLPDIMSQDKNTLPPPPTHPSIKDQKGDGDPDVLLFLFKKLGSMFGPLGSMFGTTNERHIFTRMPWIHFLWWGGRREANRVPRHDFLPVVVFDSRLVFTLPRLTLSEGGGGSKDNVNLTLSVAIRAWTSPLS